MAALLEVENLAVAYGGVRALNGVSLRVEAGEFVSIVGANGAGKTSLIRAIAGMVAKGAGAVRYRGADVTRCSNADICERGIAQVPEGRQIFPSLSVAENLWIGGALKRSRRDRRRNLERVYAQFPRLVERKGQSAGTLSGGEQQMLAIGRAMMAMPELILFDEPSLGLSPLLTGEMFELIRTLNAAGTTILLVEQNVAESLAASHRAYVFETGSVVLEGTSADLLADDRVKQAYLGF
jgi:branched-chain amino acid transport system ATP-binding protein